MQVIEFMRISLGLSIQAASDGEPAVRFDCAS